MPSLYEAFKHMRRKGLAARMARYCEDCARKLLPPVARRLRERKGKVLGFAHLREWDELSSPEEFRVPIAFGTLAGDRLIYRHPGCLAVGDLVAACLDRAGIDFEWDRRPGSAILAVRDGSLPEVPAGGGHQPVLSDEGHETFRSAAVPDGALDRLGGNPVRVVNLEAVRRLGLDLPCLDGPRPSPEVGDDVKLGFHVRDAVAHLACRALGGLIDRMQLEAMWVEVTGASGTGPVQSFRGELLNVPRFIDPARLRIGSPVEFTAEHVYPAESPSRQYREARG
jgi:hypothetical protein